MRLSERIYQFRTERKMSQGDLAEALEVSRQSVSKWETGAAVPELDKLIRMGEVFGVSLDELIKGSTSPSDTVAPITPPTSVVYVRREPRLTAALILLIFGGAMLFLLSLLGGILTGILCSLPFFACAAVCYAFKKRVGLWCGWAIYVLLQLYLSFTTAIRYNTWLGNLIMRLRYREDGAEHFAFNMHDIVSIVMFLLAVVLIVLTARSFRDLRLRPTGKTILPVAIGAALYLGMHGLVAFLGYAVQEQPQVGPVEDVLGSGLYLFYRIISDLAYHAQYVGFTVLLILGLALVRGRKEK